MTKATTRLGARGLRRYDRYREAGHRWFGCIPAHWTARRLKYLVTWNDEALPESTDPGFEMSYIDIGGVDPIGGIVEQEDLAFEKAPSRARRIVRHGDVLISTVRTYLRAISAVEHPASNLVVSTGFAVLRPRRLKSAFAAYAFRAPHFVERIVASSVGVSYPAIKASSLVCIAIPVPDVDEQTAIADFLGRETAKIDALVAKKERLIKLLQEKHTTLITRAVTCGVDPDVPMKDSGIEWLGDVPAHWEVKPLKWAITFQRGHDLPSQERQTGDVPVVSSSGVSATHSHAAASAPGIVTGRYGTIGHFYLVAEDYWPLNTTLYSVDLRDNRPRFLAYMLRNLSSLFVANAQKSAVPGVDRNDIHTIETAIPSPPEQQNIADFLDRESRKVDALVEKVNEAIGKLNEYRTALISAAVTGKIDVREATPR